MYQPLRSNGLYHCVLLFLMLVFCRTTVRCQGFLKADGKFIVNEKGEQVLLRGIGLGGWMLQEGYMFGLQGEGQQYRIREKIKDVIGEEKTTAFYKAWLSNYMQKADVDALKSWGFNSIRLPLHFNLYTLPVEQEPVKGEHTWLEKGFALTDSLLKWCKDNKMYLILDLHAAPGGQGNDLNISDRDPSKSSLWDCEDNQRKMVALWRKLAARYAGEPWIGGYDLINEPNWGFTDPQDRNGEQERNNEPLRRLLIETTKAIREVDPNHMIIIEGNGWGNNYNGIFPLWDPNLVLSFHKYWSYNSQDFIQGFLDLREQYNVPLWLGETGENSNVWFTEAVRLVESKGIGWAWWPLKKMGVNNPLQIREPAGYQKLLNYWHGKGAKPSNKEACQTMMLLAANSRIENCTVHPDVLDALFRQVYSSQAIPFKQHVVAKRTMIHAVDYDLGRVGFAYFDTDTADYHNSTGGDWGVWNTGRIYRNDGVDITTSADLSTNGYKITQMKQGEWLQYTLEVPSAGNYKLRLSVAALEDDCKVSIRMKDAPIKQFSFKPQLKRKKDLQILEVQNVRLAEGKMELRIYLDAGAMEFGFIEIIRNS